MDVPCLNGAKVNSPECRHVAPKPQGCRGDSTGTATAGTVSCQGWGWHWRCWELVKTAALPSSAGSGRFGGGCVHPPRIPAAVQLPFPP